MHGNGESAFVAADGFSKTLDSFFEDIIWGALAPDARVDAAGIAALYAVDYDSGIALLDAACTAGLVVVNDGSFHIAPLTRSGALAEISTLYRVTAQVFESPAFDIRVIDGRRLVDLCTDLRRCVARADALEASSRAGDVHMTVFAGCSDRDLVAEYRRHAALVQRAHALVLDRSGIDYYRGYDEIAAAVVDQDLERLKDSYHRVATTATNAALATRPAEWPQGA